MKSVMEWGRCVTLMRICRILIKEQSDNEPVRYCGSNSTCTNIVLVYSTVMNRLDPIEELYNMYSEKENTPRIEEVRDDDLDFVLDIEGPANPYMDL